MEPAIIGHCRIGYFRIGVYNPVFDRVIDRLEQYHAAVTVTADEYPYGVWDETDWDFCVWE